MTFWDSSAIVPILVKEPSADRLEALARSTPRMIVWWATQTECLSAIARRERDGTLTPQGASRARELLADLAQSWDEVQASEDVRDHARRVLLRHPLRAADALQLAAAMSWARGRPREHRFCSLDERLAEAARLEGFVA